jgi:hypothetical protein
MPTHPCLLNREPFRRASLAHNPYGEARPFATFGALRQVAERRVVVVLSAAASRGFTGCSLTLAADTIDRGRMAAWVCNLQGRRADHRLTAPFVVNRADQWYGLQVLYRQSLLYRIQRSCIEVRGLQILVGWNNCDGGAREMALLDEFQTEFRWSADEPSGVGVRSRSAGMSFGQCLPCPNSARQ